MYLGAIFLTSLLFSSWSGDNRVANARYQEALENQCTEVLGFETKTQDYINCRQTYESMFGYSALNQNSFSVAEVTAMQKQIESINEACQKQYGDEKIPTAPLWMCIREYAEMQRRANEHAQAVAEQKAIISEAIREANDDNRLQMRIDMERERVARLKGKKPEKINCYTYEKANGYIKVKCK